MKKRVIMFVLMAAVFLCVFTIRDEMSGDKRQIEAECRQLMREYEEAKAAGDKTAANRAAAMYNDYIFSYSSLWNGKVPKGIKYRLNEVE